MRIGISLATAHRTDDVRATVDRLVERTRAANAAGLESLFVGDHHITSAPYYQNVPLLGRLLTEWDDRPAGCLFLVPMWNPVLLAEQVGTLAAIARGRFIMQCGLGAGRREFGAMGVNIRERPSRFEPGFDIIKRLLAGETVSSQGRYGIEQARISPIPAEPVEYWIGGSVDAAVDRAARLGDAWLGGPELTPDQARERSAFYRERSEALGRRPAAIAIRRDVFVGRDTAHAEAIASPIVERGYRGFDPSALVTGSIESVAQQFAAYEQMGFTDIIVRHITDDQDEVLGSIARLGEVRQAVAGSAPSEQ